MSERGKGYYQKKLDYIREYGKKNYKQIILKLHIDHDQDVIDVLASKENKQGYIKDLIRLDASRANMLDED